MATKRSGNTPSPTSGTISSLPSRPSVTNLDRLTVAYLLLPNLIFLGGWLKPIWGIPTVILLVAVAVSLLWRRHAEAVSFPRTKILVSIALATAWLLPSGIGHLSFANEDWIVRDAVLVDLVTKPWPVVYPAADSGEPRILRAPIGYYLPAALASSLGGIEHADLAIFAWSLAGVSLIFYLIIRRAVGPGEMLCRLLIFMLFSGMDLIGNFLIHITLDWGQHLEWWGGKFQFSSITTALFWVPNHSLASWLALVWLLDQRRGRFNLPLAVVVAACTPLWSPLSAAGLIPFYAAAMLLKNNDDQRSIAERIRGLLNWQVVVTILIFTIFVYPYLFLHGNTIYSGWALNGLSVITAIELYLAFVVLEFALLTALLLFRFPRDVFLWIAGVSLFLIPLYSFGPNADFSMRVSLPALAVLAIKLGDWATQYIARDHNILPKSASQRIHHAAFAAALLIFAIGIVTPAEEFIRAVQKPRWDFDQTKSMTDSGAAVAHYICPRDGIWAEIFLRE